MEKIKTSLEQLCINTIRTLSIDGVQKANSGHPGLPLDAAPMVYVLWTKYLKHNPKNPEWFDRDRFILSAGHGSMLLYSLLHLTGYEEMTLDQIKQFRQLGSLTAGHPERHIQTGIEITTGPLGQGFANGVGMAIAEAYLSATFNRPDFNMIDHYTYVLASDGDLMEGVVAEAASLAGHLKLGKLICLYDDNRITLSASTELTFSEDRAKRFEAYGWHTEVIDDGNDVAAIDKAIENAKNEKERPSIILIRTHLGYGSPHKHDTFDAHGNPLGEEEVKLTKQNLGWPVETPFYIPKEAADFFHQAIAAGKRKEEEWKHLFSEYEKKHPDLAKELRGMIKGELEQGWDALITTFPPLAKGLATRKAAGEVMQEISPKLTGLIGGSADLNPSTFTDLKNFGNFENPSKAEGDLQGSVGGPWNYAGRNIFYGVREHAMGSISNGIAGHGGLIPFTATFLTFSDYMRPPIRLAALMRLQVIFVFTHDSIGLGEDGPTHQPIEHLAALRAIPHLIVIRPGDANEAAWAWRVAIMTRSAPLALIFSRQNVPTLDRSQYASADGLKKGAYILKDAPDGKPNLILMASGSELSLIVEAYEKLKDKASVRLVSFPSWELFEAQSQEYRDSVFPPSVLARLAVEAGVSQGWEKYIGELGCMISVEDFGASAPGTVIMKERGFTVDNVCEKALKILKKDYP
jgi:transketolase